LVVDHKQYFCFGRGEGKHLMDDKCSFGKPAKNLVEKNTQIINLVKGREQYFLILFYNRKYKINLNKEDGTIEQEKEIKLCLITIQI